MSYLRKAESKNFKRTSQQFEKNKSKFIQARIECTNLLNQIKAKLLEDSLDETLKNRIYLIRESLNEYILHNSKYSKIKKQEEICSLTQIKLFDIKHYNKSSTSNKSICESYNLFKKYTKLVNEYKNDIFKLSKDFKSIL